MGKAKVTQARKQTVKIEDLPEAIKVDDLPEKELTAAETSVVKGGARPLAGAFLNHNETIVSDDQD